MKFDDAIQIIDGMPMMSGSFGVSPDVVKKIIEDLREEYAPTIEMTKEQARIFTLYYDSEKPFNKNDFEYPDNLFMQSIKEKELMQAWLNPETIKIVDNKE